jgi:hypothetical protein
MAYKTLSSSISSFLETTESVEVNSISVALSTASVLEKALEQGFTLPEYVRRNHERAVLEAQACLVQWLNIQTMAALEGTVSTDNGRFAVTRETARLIEVRLDNARKEFDLVQEIILTSPASSGLLRRDLLIKALYDRAVKKGDLKAIQYIMDRVDGRPGEAKQVDLDIDNAYNVYQIIHTLFDKQLEVLNSGNGTKLVCCSRRAGKSHLLASACLIEALRRPNTRCIYISETMELTESLFNSTVNKLIDQCQLRDKNGSRLNWKHLDNGSEILIRGLSNTKDPDQIRGHNAKVIVIDEFFHLRSELLEYMQREVLQPMQMDYADDYKFLCAGTPPSIKGTFGEYAWKSWEVPHFSWTWRENPHPVSVDAREEYVENILREKGLDWTSSWVRREYGGEWIYDEDLLLYPEYHTYDPEEAIPQFYVDMVVFGIDYGVSDSDSLIGIAWDSTKRRGYVFYEAKFNRLDIRDRTISQLEYLRDRVRDAWTRALGFFGDLSPKDANKRILWDADDNNQHLTDDFNANCRLFEHSELRLNIQNAHKTDKVLMFDKIRDLLRTASLLLIQDGKTARECEMTVLKRGPNGQVFPEVDDGIYHPDLLPAMRYALWNVIGNEVYHKQGVISDSGRDRKALYIEE